MIDLISFGIVIDDIVLPDGTIHAGLLGGGGAQTVWGMAAAMEGGERVGLIAEIGGDFDADALAPLQAARIHLAGLRQTEAPTPRAWQVIDSAGNREHRWQSPLPRSITLGTPLRELLPENWQDARAYHWGLHPESPSLEDARALIARGARVSLETFKPPQRPLSAAELSHMLTACTVFSPNGLEAAGMIGSSDYAAVIHGFAEAGCHVLALRRGAAGAEVWDFHAKRGVRVPAVPTRVVDAVGAGNAFCGALLATLDEGITAAACHGVAAASYLVEQFGLPSRLPDRHDYDRRVAFARAGVIDLPYPSV